MITRIKLIQNVGTFSSDSAAASLDLTRLVLIYAENGRGKTTLASILRSLVTGDSSLIEGRRRLGSEQPPFVVLRHASQPSDVIYKDEAWNHIIPHLKIFDDSFVANNVHSGLVVEPYHRQNLHELVLGVQGVELHRTLQESVARISGHTATMTEISRKVPEEVRGGFSMDEFCALAALPDIDGLIESAERESIAAHDREAVHDKSLFESIALPEFDVQAIERVLSTDLPDLDAAAEALVKSHVHTLGEDGESWIHDGVRHGARNDYSACPFCGQNLAGLDLIRHYRAYFSESYDQLKRDVAEMAGGVAHTHAEGQQAAFERSVRIVGELGQFWTTYAGTPRIEIDTEAVVRGWAAAREAVNVALASKQSAPLEGKALSEAALMAVNNYHAHRDKIAAANKRLNDANNTILEVKSKSEEANITEVDNRLAKLRATKARHVEDFALICSGYLREREAKAQAEGERTKVRTALDDYRTNAFPAMQESVNEYLQRFNAGFRVGNFQAANIGSGSGSTSTYNVVINGNDVAVGSNKTQLSEPSFRNSLSAGDRNTLALALFLSSLDHNPNLSDTIVVIDDPVSSLDDHRSLTTIQAIRKLASRAAQVIVLSHNKRFLCGIWNGADRGESLPLEIVQIGDESSLRDWNVSQDAITEHDQRHALLQEYSANQLGERREVAAAIRPHLEGFLRVAYPGDFPVGTMLGPFVEACRQRMGQPDEILNRRAIEELAEIAEYGKRFHHERGSDVNVTGINGTELLGFVQRTLAFATLPK